MANQRQSAKSAVKKQSQSRTNFWLVMVVFTSAGNPWLFSKLVRDRSCLAPRPVLGGDHGRADHGK